MQTPEIVQPLDWFKETLTKRSAKLSLAEPDFPTPHIAYPCLGEPLKRLKSCIEEVRKSCKQP